jgi:SAM-dependent methyltransferase
MSKNNPRIVNYYQTVYDERSRLTRDNAHRVEFITTLHLLKRYLPAGCKVLDCCAGGGAYAFPLADLGFQVTAGDLTPAHVDTLRDGNKDGLLEHVYEGSALNIPFSDNTFDAVLCMGAFYHLDEPEDRKRCVAECLRVLKDGGLFVFTYINRHAQFITHFNSGIASEEELRAIKELGWIGIFYSMDFGEADKLVKDFPIEKITEAGVDGPVYLLKERLNALTDTEFAAFIDYHISTCEQPAILSHSVHGLWAGQYKPL